MGWPSYFEDIEKLRGWAQSERRNWQRDSKPSATEEKQIIDIEVARANFRSKQDAFYKMLKTVEMRAKSYLKLETDPLIDGRSLIEQIDAALKVERKKTEELSKKNLMLKRENNDLGEKIKSLQAELKSQHSAAAAKRKNAQPQQSQDKKSLKEGRARKKNAEKNLKLESWNLKNRLDAKRRLDASLEKKSDQMRATGNIKSPPPAP